MSGRFVAYPMMFPMKLRPICSAFNPNFTPSSAGISTQIRTLQNPKMMLCASVAMNTAHRPRSLKGPKNWDASRGIEPGILLKWRYA